jgi:hypothetical protein
MAFLEWARRSQALRRDTAQSRPTLFFLLEVGRHAAVMALVIVVADTTPWPFQQGSPWARVWFIGAWSVLMAGWSLVRQRLWGGRSTGGRAIS